MLFTWDDDKSRSREISPLSFPAFCARLDRANLSFFYRPLLLSTEKLRDTRYTKLQERGREREETASVSWHRFSNCIRSLYCSGIHCIKRLRLAQMAKEDLRLPSRSPEMGESRRGRAPSSVYSQVSDLLAYNGCFSLNDKASSIFSQCQTRKI